MRSVFAQTALLPAGWADNVLVWVRDGQIVGVEQGSQGLGATDRLDVLLPGVANLHSHGFQYLMAGLTEGGGGTTDFWSWRTLMYRFVAALDPDSLQDIYTFVFAEMLKAGYTSVAEFHYVHNDAKGSTYGQPAELSLRVVEAARSAGIGITHLPTIYERPGFDGGALDPLQNRFKCDLDRAGRIAETIAETYGEDPMVSVGLAPHSLRAVDRSTLGKIKGLAEVLLPRTPIHVHISEQVREVEECKARFGCEPINLLYQSAEVDDTWCLVHCTHATPEEFKRIADSGAVVAICPLTEGNLGDGTVDFPTLKGTNAAYGIGSDSQISLNPWWEWRLLEYQQRFANRRRNIAAEGTFSTGRSLFQASAASAEAASGRNVGRIAAGYSADLLEVRRSTPSLEGLEGDQILDACIFAANTLPISAVMAGGHWLVRDGLHVKESLIKNNYRRAVAQMRAKL